MSLPSHSTRFWAALGALALGLFIAGCTILPQWKLPATQIIHNSALGLNGALDDQTPDMVVVNGLRYVVFAGEAISGGDLELFLQTFNVHGAASVITGTVQLTNNNVHDFSPQIATDGLGNLYVVWVEEFGPGDNDIRWIKIRASDMAILNGPVNVTFTFDNEIDPQFVTNNSYSLIVWERWVPTSTVRYVQVNNSTGAILTPTVVSQGTGCAGSFPQLDPQITRSASGNYAEIVWEGQEDGAGADSIYWREIFTISGQPSSDCIVLSSGVGAGGDDSNPRVAINSSNRSFVTWTRQDTGDFSTDVIMRSIDFFYNICGYYRPTNTTAVNDYASTIAAGHVVSDWVHLAWERTASGNGILYQLLDANDCSNPNTPALQVGSQITISTSPVPSGADVDSPKIAVQTNAEIAVPLAASLEALKLAPEKVQRLAESGQISQAEAEAVLADGVVSDEEIMLLANNWLAAQAQRQAALPTVPANEASGEDQGVVAGGGLLPDCAAEPENEKCLWAAQQLGGAAPTFAAPTNFSGCGTNAADAVGISFIDDTNQRMYVAYFQAGEALSGGVCYVFPFFDGQVTQLTRSNFDPVGDYDDHTIVIDSNGLASVAWSGRVPASFFILTFPANDEIFFASTQYPVTLPFIMR